MAEESPEHSTAVRVSANSPPVERTSISEDKGYDQKYLDASQVQVSLDVASGNVISTSGML